MAILSWKIFNRNVDVKGQLKAESLQVNSKDLSHVVVYAGTATTAGGAAAEDITISGVLATDVAIAVIKDNGTNNVTLLQTVAAADKITATFSADPGNDAVVSYVVLRAV